LTQWEYRE